jgi:hypothetical protein
MYRVKVAWLAGAAAWLLACSSAFAGEVVMAADLKPTDADPTASGHAVWTLDTGTGVKTLSITVQGVQSTYLARAFVNHRFVGYLLVSDGAAQLNLDSSKGDAVPRVPPGAPVDVLDADQQLILQGTFEPSP